MQGRGQHQPELVPELHRVEPRVDVQDEVHFERLGLAVQPAASVELFALRVHVLHVEDVLEQDSGHSERWFCLQTVVSAAERGLVEVSRF